MKDEFHLSVVVTTRNDNHGQNLNYRMQHFVDGFVEQCKRHNLKAELIFVEWNPPEDRPPLSEALNFPSEKGPCAIRIIRVPNEVHKTFKHSDGIPLFQMIGKNVGIRRARGKFILATNIDILFSDELFKFIQKELKAGFLYRVDRLDVPQTLPNSDSFDKILNYCAKNFFRINGKYGSKLSYKNTLLRFCWAQLKKAYFFVQNLFRKSLTDYFRDLVALIKKLLNKSLAELLIFPVVFPYRTIKKITKRCVCIIYPKCSLILHTNACGDFTLLSSEDWSRLKGYPEWHYFSWHLDSVLLFQARNHGIQELDLPRKMSIYHIEHEIGSGYSPEGADKLFKRLDSKGITYLSNADLDKLLHDMDNNKTGVIYNKEDWGMSSLTFEETWV